MRSLAAALAVCVLAMPAGAVELGRVTPFDQLREQLYRSEHVEAEAIMANATTLGRIGEIDPKLAEALPFGGRAILYFAENGDLLAWSDKSKVVEVGYWEVMSGGAFNELCVRFGHFGLTSLCAAPDMPGSDWISEITPGNPFGLVAGATVPQQLGQGADLESIAERLP